MLFQDYLEEYNVITSKKMNLIFFMDCIEHVARLARILRAEWGHALLVGNGGIGKRSLSRLGACLCGYKWVTEMYSSCILKWWRTVKQHPAALTSQWPTWCQIFFNTFIMILYMYTFWAISCSSSGGQIVLIQHLVSSLWKQVSCELWVQSEQSTIFARTEIKYLKKILQCFKTRTFCPCVKKYYLQVQSMLRFSRLSCQDCFVKWSKLKCKGNMSYKLPVEARYQKSVYCSSIHIYNNLPDDLAQLVSSMKHFLIQLKKNI